MEETERPADANAQNDAGNTADQVLNQLRGLRRSSDDKVLAGVAGGISRSLGIDPLLLRVVIAVLVLFGGAGVVLYALAWLLIPLDDGTPSVGAQALDRPRFRPSSGTVWLAVILAIAITIGVIGAFAQWHGSLLIALAVIGLLVLLLRQDNHGSRPAGTLSYPAGTATPVPQPQPSYPPPAQSQGSAQPPGPAQGSAQPPASVQDTAAPMTVAAGVGATQPSTVVGTPVPPPPPSWAGPTQPQPPVPPMPPRPPKPRSYLFGVTFSVALIALGAVGALDLWGVDVPAGAYPAVALTLAGLGLLVGAWFGRARWLIFWGILLIPVLAVATVAGKASSISHRAVDKQVVITQVDQLPTDDRYGAGQVEYDLTGLNPVGLNASMGAQIGFGEIIVTVPRGVDVRVSARVGVGGLTLFNQESGGVNERINRVDNGFDGVGGGQLNLDLYAGFGHLEVRRAAS